MRDKRFGELSESRQNNFDFLRLFLATVVIFSHNYHFLQGNHPNEPVLLWTHQQADGGAIAVDFFFVISGFLITISWINSKGLWDFLKKRILRIYPGFIVVSLFCALVVAPLGAPGFAEYFHYFRPAEFVKHLPTLHLDGLPYYRPDGAPYLFANTKLPSVVNGSLWTIEYEFKCYLLVALLGLIGAYRQRAVPLALFVAAFAAYNMQQLFHIGVSEDAKLPIVGNLAHLMRFSSYFLAGMVVYLYRDTLPHAKKWFLLSLVLVLIGSPRALCFVLPLFGTYALLYLAFDRSLKLERFGERGDLSYGTYLYAFPVQQLFVTFFPGRFNVVTLFLAAFPVTLLLAALSWFGVERPFLRLKKTGVRR